MGHSSKIQPFAWKILAVVVVFITGSLGVQFQIKNNSPRAIWIGIQGGNGKPHLAGGGFILNRNAQRTVSSPADWEGRFWARTGCNGISKHCDTGDCGNRLACAGNGGAPPATLVEIKLKGAGGQDFYDISLVDGFNVKASITPVKGRGSCKALACKTDLNPGCPNDLKQFVRGGLVACYSSCLKFKTDQFCCTGQFNGPAKCNPNSWRVNSAKYFKQHCPDAYSYAYDDKNSLRTCIASTYRITFG